MALGATIYRFEIDLSDVDRGVYETLDLRVARHPSESTRFLLARVIAHCLCHEEGIAFGRGLSTTDEPALWVKDLRGDLRVWIEIGAPSPERLHKASKACPRVVVFTHGDPAPFVRAARAATIHRAAEIEVYALPAAFLDELEELIERTSRWQLVHTAGELYVTSGPRNVSGTVTRHSLASASA